MVVPCIMNWLILLVNGDNTMSNGISLQARSQAGVRAVRSDNTPAALIGHLSAADC